MLVIIIKHQDYEYKTAHDAGILATTSCLTSCHKALYNDHVIGTGAEPPR